MGLSVKNGGKISRGVSVQTGGGSVPNVLAEAAVIELLTNTFDGVAFMDPDAVRQNIVFASGGFSKDDRSMRMELANYLLAHFAVIYAGLVINDDFRNTFMEAVSVEVALDSETPEFVQSVRSEMADKNPRESRGDFVVDLSRYDDSAYRNINAKLSSSFGKVVRFGSSIDNFAAMLSDDAMIDIGYCVSNFMYAFRAFSKNAAFAGYVKSVVHSVENTLGIV